MLYCTQDERGLYFGIYGNPSDANVSILFTPEEHTMPAGVAKELFHYLLNDCHRDRVSRVSSGLAMASSCIATAVLCATATRYSVIDQQHHNRADDRDNHAVNIQTCHSRCSEQIKQKSANKSANDSKRNVEPKALALPIDDLAADETGDETENDPRDNGHALLPRSCCL